jgi:acyl dehydratase
VAPTFHGDTIYGETTVLAKRLTSRGDRGMVEVKTRGVTGSSATPVTCPGCR